MGWAGSASGRIRANDVSICRIGALGTSPSRRKNRAEAMDRTARQTARLGRSSPVACEAISTRRGEGAAELDRGTTTINSPGVSLSSSSEETTTAGLVLPGSLVRAAPSATSHTSPRCGDSVESIGDSLVPVIQFCLRLAAALICLGGITLTAKHGLLVAFHGDLTDEGGD